MPVSSNTANLLTLCCVVLISSILTTFSLNGLGSVQGQVVRSFEEVPSLNGNSIVEELMEAISPANLKRLSKRYKKEYASAMPFPHIAIDGIFPESILQKVLEENPENALNEDGCLDPEKCFLQKKQHKKSYTDDEKDMGIYTRLLFSVIKSSTFIHFLQDLTNIQGLLPDPHYRGSGLHITAPGGHLNIHADFNKYRDPYQLDRRVNTFIYLNNDWLEDYGGHLELWSPNMQSCVQRILPTLGRFVVFSSTDFSYHGQPQPLTAPLGRARRSLALYYYTNGRPKEECLDGDCSGRGHSTLFKKPVGCEKCEEDMCKAYDESKPNWVTGGEVEKQ
jgi:Rps23 Pro-64 3,4-dihydroxylase Tpa1-like proline 4-hydroxylase